MSSLPFPAGDSLSDAQALGACSDRGLLRRFNAGDQNAFSELVRRHAGLVQGVCRRVLGASAEIDDAFQATFLVLAKKARALRWDESIAGWLHETARRTALRLRGTAARRGRRETAAEVEAEARTADPAGQAALRELSALLDEELAALPDKFREVIVLSQFEGLGREEIAARLSLDLGAVKDRLERGREKLRARLVRRGVTLTSTALAAWLAPAAAQAATSTVVAATAHTACAFAAGNVVAGGSASAAVILAQGVLKTMAWEKMKYAAFWCLTLMATGGVAYGVLRDDPQRLEQGLRGHVVEVVRAGERRSLTVRLDEFEALLSLDVAPAAQVWNAYESRDFHDVRVGQYVALRLADDHRTVREVHIVGERFEVRIDAVAPDGTWEVTQTEHDDDVPAPKHRFALAAGAILRIGGLPATREDFRPGMIVPLELAADGRTIHAVEAEAEPETLLEGEVVRIEAAAGESAGAVVVAGEDANDAAFERRLPVAAGAMLIIDGKPGELSQLRAGATIHLRLAVDRTSIRALRATNPEQEIDDDGPPAPPAI